MRCCGDSPQAAHAEGQQQRGRHKEQCSCNKCRQISVAFCIYAPHSQCGTAYGMPPVAMTMRMGPVLSLSSRTAVTTR